MDHQVGLHHQFQLKSEAPVTPAKTPSGLPQKPPPAPPRMTEDELKKKLPEGVLLQGLENLPREVQDNVIKMANEMSEALKGMQFTNEKLLSTAVNLKDILDDIVDRHKDLNDPKSDQAFINTVKSRLDNDTKEFNEIIQEFREYKEGNQVPLLQRAEKLAEDRE